MKVQFWGTRGSIAKAGPSTVRYGGNTSCVELRSAAGTLVVLDCGTGAQDLGQALLAETPPRTRGHLLISHTHWDHIQGIPFFAPLAVAGNEWDVYAPRGLSQSLRETLAGQMQYTYFPVTLEALGATIRYHDLVEGVFAVGDVTVRTQYLNHPALTLGYRLEADGVAVVYACDHEPHSRQLASGSGEIGEQDQRHLDFLRGADLVIHDAQYTSDEYPEKAGWGHSTVDYAVEICRRAGVTRLALTHHEPLRDDTGVDRLLAHARAAAGSSLEVVAAAEGMTIDLGAVEPRRDATAADDFSAVAPVMPALWEHTILVGSADRETIATLQEAAGAEGLHVEVTATAGAMLRAFESQPPSLVILDDGLPGTDATEFSRRLRSLDGSSSCPVPIVVLADEERADAGVDATDWLLRPFSTEYARTRMRAWVLRNACRWMRAPLPQDEGRRLAALRALSVLDTAPEERFDRITRIAAATFDVPIALVSLVDRDRQWFKSCHGLEVSETSREAAFCAHAILGRDVMVVPDALQDGRFADNPLVTGPPHVRFYAGCPLALPGQSPVGTLCLLDVHPRELAEEERALLRDFGALVVRELGTDGA